MMIVNFRAGGRSVAAGCGWFRCAQADLCSLSPGYGENGFLDLGQPEMPDHLQIDVR